MRPSGVNIFITTRLRDRWADIDETWHLYSVGLKFGPCAARESRPTPTGMLICNKLRLKSSDVCVRCDQYKMYSGNAVVISTVCLLLLFVVVGLTLSHYWDVVQRRRYSNVPLCGLDGPFRYQLLVVTGKLPGAGMSFAVSDASQQCPAFCQLVAY